MNAFSTSNKEPLVVNQEELDSANIDLDEDNFKLMIKCMLKEKYDTNKMYNNDTGNCQDYKNGGSYNNIDITNTLQDIF